MIFVDTGALLGRYLKNDQHHQKATAYWRELGKARKPLVTSNFVLDETATLLARRAGYAFAAERIKTIYASSAFRIVRPAASDELEALVLFEKYADQKVSFTDCVSSVLMRKEGLQRVFSFDTHFRLMGLELLP